MCIEGFPSVREVQKKLGEDKVAVLLLDNEHQIGTKLKKAWKKAEKFFATSKLDMPWQRILVPDGSDTIHKVFNKSGYGLILVDPQGRVVSTDIRSKQLSLVLNKGTVGKATLPKPKITQVTKPLIQTVLVTAGEPIFKPGNLLVLPIKLKIPTGWHIYGEAEKTGVPTSLKVLECGALRLKSVVIPKGKHVVRNGIASSHLEGEVVLLATFEIPKHKKRAPIDVRGSVHFMICDAQSCLPPTTLTWQAAVDTSAATSH
ncbi:MAG: hypothetical protein ACI97A_001345 [Planctomycetota bacterium]